MFSTMHRAVGRRYQCLLGAVRRQGTGGQDESVVIPAVRSRLAGVHRERTRQAVGRQKSGVLRELNEDLREVCGGPVMTVADAIRALWEYVREHDLRPRRGPPGIRCDERLQRLSGKDWVHVRDVMKIVYRNSARLEPAPAAGGTGQVEPPDGRPYAGRYTPGNSAHVRVPHGELAEICGTEPLTFQDAEKKLWEHRRSLLTDPDNGLERAQELSCERSNIAQFILENSLRHVK